MEIPAEVTVPLEDGPIVPFLTHQLGKGGCMLKGGERITPGKVVEVSLNLGGVQITAISEIFYEYETDGKIMLGVRFLEIEPSSEKKLEEFIAFHLKDAGSDGLRVESSPSGPALSSPLPKETEAEAYICTVCRYVYDPVKGNKSSGTSAGTAFESLPDRWACPDCGAGTDMFEPAFD